MKQSYILVLLFYFCTCSYAQSQNELSPSEKIYGISKFWQEVNYNFAYFDQVPELNWDSVYQIYLKKVLATKSDYQYYRTLQAFCALLEDGHTNIYMPRRLDTITYRTSFGKYRIFVENISGKAIISRVNEPMLKEIPIGSEIIEVEGLPTATYIKENVTPYISSSTDYILKANSIRDVLKGLKGESIKIKIRKPDKTTASFNLTRKLNHDKIYPAFEPWKLFEFKWLEHKTAYVSLNSFGNPKIDTLFFEKLPELYQAEKLIIDLRKNGGGSTNIGREIAKYLTTDKLLYGSKNKTRKHIASYKAWGGFVEAKDTLNNSWASKSYQYFHDQVWYEFDYAPDTNDVTASKITVPTVVLIGNYTASAAEDFLIYLDKQKHITKMGASTYGSTGQPFLFDLPGGALARVCTKKDTYPDDREFVGYGIPADIKVSKSLADLLENRDRTLELALKYLNKEELEAKRK